MERVRPSFQTKRQFHTLEILLYLALSLAGLCRALVVWQFEVNWDEFFFLSHVYEYLRGDLSQVLQTAYVHFFTWLTRMPFDEVGQIRVARTLMLLLQLATGWLLYRICCTYFSRLPAMFGVLSYFSFSYVILHGTSFRADPIATFLLVLCLYQLLVPDANNSRMIIAGVSLGVAGVITIKSIFYVPTIAALMLIEMSNGENKRSTFFRFFLVALSSLLAFLMFYYFHKYTIGGASQPETAKKLANIYNKVAGDSVFFPTRYYLQRTIYSDLVFWLVLLAGIVISIMDAVQAREGVRERGLIVLAMVLPLVTFAFYRNSFPYFYVFILAPVCVACAQVFSFLFLRLGQQRARLWGVVMIGIYMVNLCVYGVFKPLANSNQHQRDLLQAVHDMFPQPVNYIDRNSMLVSYPKSGFFMSSWGMDSIRSTRKGIIAEIINREQPKFVLANTPYLDLDNISYDVSRGLSEVDIKSLKGNYIHHWSWIYVAGKSFQIDDLSTVVSFDIRIEGVYTVESDHSVLIDGHRYDPNSPIQLDRGIHGLSMPDYAGRVSLRWGENLYLPFEQEIIRPVYTYF